MVISVELADQIHPCDTMPINLIGEAERAVGHNPSLARTGVYGAGVFPSALVTKQQAYQRFERTAARIDPELILLVRVSGEAMPDPRPLACKAYSARVRTSRTVHPVRADGVVGPRRVACGRGR
jgi:hypothetical protein